MIRPAPSSDERTDAMVETLESTGWAYCLEEIKKHVGVIRREVFAGDESDRDTALKAREVKAVGRLLDMLYRRAGMDGLPAAHRSMIE